MDSQTSVSPIRIMIVDDHPNTARMLARVLSKFDEDVDILTASSGEDAIERIGDEGLDILITDYMMPGMNGLELIEKLSTNQKPTHTILITAYDTPALASSAQNMKVTDYLVKPVQPEKIHSLVSEIINQLHKTRKHYLEKTP